MTAKKHDKAITGVKQAVKAHAIIERLASDSGEEEGDELETEQEDKELRTVEQWSE